MKRLALCLLTLLPTLAIAKKNDSLDIKIGQMIMIGIDARTSLQANDVLIPELNSGKIGGVVLFEKNIAKQQSKDSLRMLVGALQQQSKTPLFVSIDEEGGRVHRLKEKYGFVAMPSAAYLGRLNNADSTLYYNRRLAALLKDIGININYAPCIDVAVNPENTVIVKNERSFSADPAMVVEQAKLVMQAHHEYGVKTIIKHFPGHGSSTGDSHTGIVDVSKTWQLKEMLPYDALVRSSDIDAVMSAHIINSRWDESMLPATLSAKAINGMLRGMLGYKGVVFSDDMQMQAISDNYGLNNAIALAVNSGIDVVMFANTTPNKDKLVTATQVHSIIKKLVRKKKISRARIDEAYARIMELKAKG